jgi:DNA/RNA-binding domain of Phe-tRNA-synthetase-like protein
MSDELELERGWVTGELREEFPELALVCTRVEARSRRSPAPLKQRMREASNRFNGPRAIAMRQQPIPWAYRVFYRHIGIDPDETRTPVEAMALERLMAGGFKSRNTLDDGLVLATIDTGVPVVAFDADRLSGELGLRLARDGELLGGDGRFLRDRQLVIADGEQAVALLFGEVADGRGVTAETERMLLAAVQVKGVPAVSVEEALWTVVDVLVASGAEGR